MKRIRLIAVKLLRKENADSVESLFLYTNKRPSKTLNYVNCQQFAKGLGMKCFFWKIFGQEDVIS